MITKTSTATSARSGNRATTTHSSSTIARRNDTDHLTLIVILAVIIVALAWGFYESMQLLTTGLIPRF